jgi:ABC-type dipeptide/oligopeptide/nickel transport system ATPase component
VLFQAPQHPVTQQLLQSLPGARPVPAG